MSEFEAAGIGSEPSLRVKPPRVAGSPVALECEVHTTLGIGDATVVFGRVVHAVVSQEVLVDGHPEISRMKPLSRLGKDEWGTVGDVREISCIRHADWQAGGRSVGRGSGRRGRGGRAAREAGEGIASAGSPPRRRVS